MKQSDKSFWHSNLLLGFMPPDLRVKFIYSFLGLLLTTTIGIVVSKKLILLLENQMPFDINYIQVSPVEVLMASFKIALFFGLYITGPFLLYSLFKYILSKRYTFEKKSVIISLLILYASSFLGLLVGYFALLPLTFDFLLGFNSGVADVSLSISSYVTSCLSVLLFSIILFSIPALSKMMNKFGLTIPELSLKQVGTFALILSIIFIFPPELFSILSFAVAVLILWKLYGFATRFLKR